ncbi:hypothetical protein KSP40_PGU006205 [Platanthera guangdongensis]|uniref:Uncharacterized protein n=1 Tax=Platanthera guangdongensis TaxID=2320717 RepID=A0ABR2MF51_9ASPA
MEQKPQLPRPSMLREIPFLYLALQIMKSGPLFIPSKGARILIDRLIVFENEKSKWSGGFYTKLITDPLKSDAFAAVVEDGAENGIASNNDVGDIIVDVDAKHADDAERSTTVASECEVGTASN